MEGERPSSAAKVINSARTLSLYVVMRVTLSLSPFSFSLDSMEERTRHEARRAPTTFLYATLSKFRSCKVDQEWHPAAR